MIDVVLSVLLVIAALGAGALFWDSRTFPSGSGDSDSEGEGTPSVSVVVPARDEESTLPALLESVRALAPGAIEVVVVDDDSHDATAATARSNGARVLCASPPPPGWTGKAWACHLGARSTSGDLLLFLDADTVLAPHALGRLLDLHERHHGLISVQPYHRVVRPYEQLSSYFNVVSLLASGAFARRAATRPMAFGPCLLTSRVDYEHAGGHAAVRGAILDDVELAVAYDRGGLSVHCLLGGESVRMRSYPGGVRQWASGWSKNFASGASAAAPVPALVAGAWIGAHHAIAVGAGLALVESLTGRGASLTYGSPVLWLLAWFGVAWQLGSMLHRIGSFRWWTWMLFPAPLLAFDVIFARSVLLTLVRGSVSWRGREVDLRGSGTTEEAL